MSEVNEDKETRLFNRQKKSLLKKLDAKVFKAIDAALSENGNVDDLSKLSKDLDDALTELAAYNVKIYDHLLDLEDNGNDGALEDEMDRDNDLKMKINEFKAKIEKATKTPIIIPEPKPDEASAATTTATTTKRRAKVPDLKIPTFGGSFLEWDTFRETFDALIGDKPEYTDIEKFSYLRAHITGTAKQCIYSFPTSAANYLPA